MERLVFLCAVINALKAIHKEETASSGIVNKINHDSMKVQFA
ncbi:hypothetical protein [Facklamia hominis]